MKKLLLSCIAVAGTFSAVSAQSVAHGYQMGDEKGQFGFISFSVDNFANPIMDKRVYGDSHISAGECVDGLYYTFDVFADAMGGISGGDYKIYDAEDFTVVKHIPSYDTTCRVVDMTYDYTTNTMYALVENAVTTSQITSTSLNIVDLADGKCYPVGPTGELKAIDGYGREVDESLITLAADKDGNLYAMGGYRQFYKLDKLTGAATKISASQHPIATDDAFQSMAFDTEGVLYWAQTHPDYGYFLTIDPATGVASYMAEDPDPSTIWKNEASILGANAEVTGLWFEKPFDASAPAAPADVKAVRRDGTASTIDLTWTLPANDLAGNATAITAIAVYRLGSATPVATLAADATSWTDTDAPNGLQTYMICAFNGDKHGRGALAQVFAGADSLMPVGNLTASIANSEVTLAWTAPTATENGGYADFDNITYRVWRIKGNEEIMIAKDVTETTYTDVLAEPGTYFYSVEPVSCGVIGYAKDSDPVTYAKAASIPYFSGFEDNGDGSLWTFANNHTNTSYGWTITAGYTAQQYDGKFAQLKSEGASNPCDDYMFSPAIEFTPGTYTLTYMMNGSLSSDTHSWEIYLAEAPEASAAHAVEIESHSDEKVGNAYIASPAATFTVAEAGTYHLVFHGTTTCSYATLKIDNVSITKAPASIPYACDFEDGSDADWTIANTNPHIERTAGWAMASDATSPHGANIAQLYVYSVSDGEYDDWMISPAISFDEAGTYTLTYAASGKSWDKHKWEICLGTDAADKASFATAIASHDQAKFGAWADYTADFAVTTPGTYHIGLHGQGCDAVTRLNVDNIRITRAASDGIFDSITAQPDAVPVEYYNLQGKRLSAPQSGLIIVRYSDGTARKEFIR